MIREEGVGIPFTSSNTVLFQCGQHRIGPDTRFGPSPSGSSLFGGFRLVGQRLPSHLTRLFFQGSVLSRIYLPASLGSTGVTLLQSYYECSDFRFGDLHTPCWPFGGGWSRMTDPTRPKADIPLYLVETSFHSVTNHPPLPKGSICFIPLADLDLPCDESRHLGLRHLLAGSSQRQAESCSSSYGLEIHLQLLSTSLRRNAVTVD